MEGMGYEESMGVGKNLHNVSTDSSSSGANSSSSNSNSSSSSSGSNDDDNGNSNSSIKGSISSRLRPGLGSELDQPTIKKHSLFYRLQMCYSGVGLKILACAVHGFTFYLVKNVISRYYSYMPRKS